MATQPKEAVADAPIVETPAPDTEASTTERTSTAETVEELYEDDPAKEAVADTDGADEDSEGEGDEDEEAGEKAEAASIPPPLSWKAEEKAEFAKLPREAQEVIARRETERERFIQSKAQEAAQARHTAMQEAMQAIQVLRQQQAEELNQIAAQIEPQKPSYRLQAEDPDAYADQMEAYEYWAAQRQRAQQLAHQRQQEAKHLEQQREQQIAALEAQQTEAILAEKFPEYLDPNEGPKLRRELGTVAIELGYSAEQLASVDATDIIAMRTVHEYKVDALKWREEQKRKMEAVRAAKQLPKLAKPGTPSGRKPRTDDPVKLLYPND